MVSGAPDYQRVFTLVAPSMTHGAPDWERTAVGPGGAPVAGMTPLGQILLGAPVLLPAGATTSLGTITLANVAPGYAMLSFAFLVGLVCDGAANHGLRVEAGGDFTGYSSFPEYDMYPSVAVTGLIVTPAWTGLVYLTQAAAVVTLAAQTTSGTSGGADSRNNGAILGVWQ